MKYQLLTTKTGFVKILSLIENDAQDITLNIFKVILLHALK